MEESWPKFLRGKWFWLFIKKLIGVHGRLTSSFSETCGDKDCGCFRLASCFSCESIERKWSYWNQICKKGAEVSSFSRCRCFKFIASTSTHHFLLYNLFDFRQITPVECFTVGWIGRLYAVIVADNLWCVLNRFHRWRQLKALERIFNLFGVMLDQVEGWRRSGERWSYSVWRWRLWFFLLLVLEKKTWVLLMLEDAWLGITLDFLSDPFLSADLSTGNLSVLLCDNLRNCCGSHFFLMTREHVRVSNMVKCWNCKCRKLRMKFSNF